MASKARKPSKHELEARKLFESKLPNPLPEEWKLNKFQKIPLEGTASEALKVWGDNDLLLLVTNLASYRDGKKPTITADAITAGRRLDEVTAKILKLENAKPEENLEKLQRLLGRALEVDLAIGQLSRDFKYLTDERKDHPAGALAPANRSPDQTMSIWQMIAYENLKKEAKHLDLIRADLLHTNILMALEKTVGLPKKEE